MFAQLVFLAAQVTSPMLDGYDQITPQAAAERVARCGAGPVTVRSEKEIDVDVLVVTAKRPITDEQISCIAKAASFYDVELPPDAQPRLNAVTTARSVAITRAEGTKWLSAHNLLDKLPEYKAGVTNDEEFARKVETLCRADGALQSSYGAHALSPEWGMEHLGETTEDGPFACVLNAAWASGFKLGFIGNEQATP
jgi:hypothetical protein